MAICDLQFRAVSNLVYYSSVMRSHPSNAVRKDIQESFISKCHLRLESKRMIKIVGFIYICYFNVRSELERFKAF